MIIPTHNRAEILQRAVKSVLAQTFTDLELLIVDDCSFDETPEVVAGFVDPRVRYFRHSLNGGTAKTRNTGIANARGKYIAFLDDDDEFLPTKIEQQVQVLDASSSEVGMVYVWIKHVGPDGGQLGTMCHTSEGYVFDEALALSLSLTVGSTAMFRRCVFDVVGRFDATMRRAEDADFSCRVTKHFKVASIPRFLVRYHVGHPSKSEPYSASKRELIVRRDFVLRHLAKYRDDLAKRRRTRAAVWLRLGRIEWQIGNRVNSLRAVSYALLTDPTTALYVAKRPIKWVFGRLTTPLARRRR